MQVKQILPSETSFTPITLQITINSASELSWLWDRVCNKMMPAENQHLKQTRFPLAPRSPLAAQREWAGRHLPVSEDRIVVLVQALNDLVMQQIDKDAGTRGDKTIEYHSNVVCGD